MSGGTDANGGVIAAYGTGRAGTVAPMARLLVVEDDATIGGLLEPGLRAHGHDVRWVRSGRDALTAAASAEFDLVLLDLGLPDLDGVEVCRRLRAAQPGCVLVILTARREEMDVVVGLEAGADDYLTKPFRMRELVARVGALLRRVERARELLGRRALELGDLRVDAAARRVWRGEEEVRLTPTEFELLICLASSPGAVVTRERLMADVWDWPDAAGTRTVDSHVKGLRAKLGGDLIRTVHGVGYALETPTPA